MLKYDFSAACKGSGDGLHPNNAGHAAIGNAIDLSLFPTP